jgi:hypothetical protein
MSKPTAAPAAAAAAAPAKEKDQMEVLRSALGPVIFQIALEQETIKQLFALLKQLFGGELPSESRHSLSRLMLTIAFPRCV